MSAGGSAAAEVLHILADELSAVTPAMIEAGSEALTGVSIVYVNERGQRRAYPATTTEGERLTAVWRAMLAAKLSYDAK